MTESRDQAIRGDTSPQNRRTFIRKAVTLAGGITIAPIAAIAKGQTIAPEEAAEIIAEIAKKMPSSGLNLSASAGPCIENFLGDINQDCEVDIDDLNIMSSDWMSSNASAISNIDGSYTYIPNPGSASANIGGGHTYASVQDSGSSRIYVDFHDFSLLARDWGKQSLPI